MRLLRQKSPLPKEGEQLRWAYAIATRVCLNRLRKGAWESPAGELFPGDDLVAAPPQGHEWLVSRDLANRMLADQDEEVRAIAWLVLVDGHSQEEAGALLGLSRKTVGKKLNAFLKASRRFVVAEGA